MSNDRSNLDGIIDEVLPGVFGTVPAVALDGINVFAKPLGLEPVLKPLSGLLGTVWGSFAPLVPMPLKLGLDFAKLGAKGLGIGGLIGMKGSSDKAGITYCINNFAQISMAIKQEQRQRQAQGTRRTAPLNTL